MASGIIHSQTTKIGSFTPKSGITATLTVRQYGNVVTVNGYLRGVSLTANIPVAIGTFTGISLPPDVIRTMCSLSEQPYFPPKEVGYLSVGTDGIAEITSPITSTRAVYFSFSYIV